MMLEVEATFDISLPFRVAFEAPTLERLAERIDRAQAQQLARMNAPLQTDELCNAAFVFPLSQQGRGIPIFFNDVNLRMAHKGMWNLDCPLYAVSQWAQGSGFAKAKSVEELARVQIDGIRSFQPHGPYRLAGYSFGGLVALEIAHQLRRAGETIELLFLLDPSEPSTDGYLLRPRIQQAHATTGLEPSQCFDLPQNPCARDPRSDQWTTGGVGVDQLPALHFYGRHPNPISARLLPKDRWPAFWYTTKRLGRAYNPSPYDGEVLAMFISHQERRAMWQKLLGPTADIRSFDSDHLGMFAEPALSLWLQPLRARLEGKS